MNAWILSWSLLKVKYCTPSMIYILINTNIHHQKQKTKNNLYNLHTIYIYTYLRIPSFFIYPGYLLVPGLFFNQFFLNFLKLIASACSRSIPYYPPDVLDLYKRFKKQTLYEKHKNSSSSCTKCEY